MKVPKREIKCRAYPKKMRLYPEILQRTDPLKSNIWLWNNIPH